MSVSVRNNTSKFSQDSRLIISFSLFISPLLMFHVPMVTCFTFLFRKVLVGDTGCSGAPTGTESTGLDCPTGTLFGYRAEQQPDSKVVELEGVTGLLDEDRMLVLIPSHRGVS